MNSSTVDSTASSPVTPSVQRNAQAWYRPMWSHEHGVYVMLLVSFLTGAAAAQQWNGATTLALICAFFGFQAEHPWVMQLKQRRSWKPRFCVWGGVYSAIALALALYLYLRQGELFSPLLGIYLGAGIAFLVDLIFVWRQQQKAIVNEMATFAAVCLSAPFAYVVTTGTFPVPLLGLWLLNSLFFAGAIFTVKLRKPKTSSMTPATIYHTAALIIVLALYLLHWLPLLATCAFAVGVFKFGLIVWQRHWYCNAKIQSIAILETSSALLFLAIAALSFLPAYLSG